MTSTARFRPDDTVVLRRATPADDADLRDLAALDSTRLGDGPHLVAEVDGRLLAAVSVTTGRAIADPLRPTAGYVDLLRARAAAASSIIPVAVRRLHRLGLHRSTATAA